LRLLNSSSTTLTSGLFGLARKRENAARTPAFPAKKFRFPGWGAGQAPETLCFGTVYRVRQAVFQAISACRGRMRTRCVSWPATNRWTGRKSMQFRSNCCEPTEPVRR
jgi:hypothetical protein